MSCNKMYTLWEFGLKISKSQDLHWFYIYKAIAHYQT
jgi:hypothetical protein